MRLPRPVDNCGHCLTPERAVPVDPYLVQEIDPDELRAYYRCGDCGHRWWTSWDTRGMEVAELPWWAA